MSHLQMGKRALNPRGLRLHTANVTTGLMCERRVRSEPAHAVPRSDLRLDTLLDGCVCANQLTLCEHGSFRSTHVWLVCSSDDNDDSVNLFFWWAPDPPETSVSPSMPPRKAKGGDGRAQNSQLRR